MQAAVSQLQMQRSCRAAAGPAPLRAAPLRAAAPAAAAAARRRAVAVRASVQPSQRFPAQVCVVLGTQWGDEGKGKLVDILAQQYDVVARAQVRGGARGRFGGRGRRKPAGWPPVRAARPPPRPRCW
jgi:hypothetical protein